MKYEKVLSALLALTMVGTLAAPALAAEGTTAVPGDVVIAPAPEESAETILTRGALIAMLHERAGKPTVNYAMDYTDVAQDSPYAEAIRWASSEELAGGYGDHRFGPEDPVTREQMAVILYRYAQQQDQGFTGAWAFPLPYEDAAQVSEYAYEAVCWMTMKKVMTETGDRVFAPAGLVTRGEADAMLEQYIAVLEQSR